MKNKVNLIEQNGTSELTPRQEKAIAALLACSSVEVAARSVQIGRTTLYRWLKDEAFLAVYQEARRQARAWVPGRLQHLAGQAVYTLERIMDDPEASAQARVTAARTVLELALQALVPGPLAERQGSQGERRTEDLTVRARMEDTDNHNPTT